MNKELDELIRQKLEIDRKIKELKNSTESSRCRRTTRRKP